MTQQSTYHRGKKNYGTGYEMMARIDAQDAKIKALVEALGEAIASIADYVDYEHDGDPWTEDARAMGEMDIDDYAKDGRLTNARAALAAAKDAPNE